MNEHTPKLLLVLLAFLGASCALRADLGGSEQGHDGSSDDGSPDVANVTSAEPEPDAMVAPTPEPPDMEAGADASATDASAPSPDVGAIFDSSTMVDVGRDVATDRLAIEASISASCNDNLKDNDETDIDCGGSCPPCGIEQGCLVNADCGSWPGCDPVMGCACDALSFKCVYNHCSDRRQDESETAPDCGGGECPGCGPNKACILDSDCSATESGCDVNKGGCFCDLFTRTCVFNHCLDHKEDSSETATDCGGGQCAGCAVGAPCQQNFDCVSNACDATTVTCIANQCADHHIDGTETDIDCGGSNCAACVLGKKCISSFDCATGLTCATTYPHVCL